MSQTMPVVSTLRHQSHQSSSRLQDISKMSNNVRMINYRPPPNSVLVKVPQAVSGDKSMLCSDCDSEFADHKSLVKHTRNQHQVYQCSKCGESTVGYYR